MKKTQILVLALGIIAIGGLFLLPRVIIDNDEGKSEISSDEKDTVTESGVLHDNSVSDSQREIITSLVTKLDSEENKEKFVTFADSIAVLYKQIGKFDSAAFYFEESAEKIQNVEQWEKAGNAYYEAFGFALNDQKSVFLAEKTRNYLNKVLGKDPKRLDLKTKVAMTYVSSSNPMQGITMLREILEEDPENEQAIFNMGLLSMQSGQYKRAADRFEELVKLYPENIQGQFYLGVSYFESKQNNKAKKQFQLVKGITSDQMVLTSVESYLERL
jgi:tetratricopeptide (TPR) repeat protein